MEAGKKHINDIFNGNRQLQVPFFQRSYVWNEDLWERFLDSMTRATTIDKEYFLGALILKQKPTNTSSNIGDIRILIDGQQRLTTLFLFLKVLCYKSNKKRRFEQMVFADEEISEFSIKHNMFDRQCFENILKQESLEPIQNANSKLTLAYNYFLENVDADKQNVEKILSHISFVCIDLNSTDDEQVIFDTINSLGVRLTTGELLKNYLFSYDTVEEYRTIWKSVFEADDEAINYWEGDTALGRIMRKNLETFLYAFIHIKINEEHYGLTTSQKLRFRSNDDLFSQYKYFLEITNEDHIEFAKDIASYAKLYMSKINPNVLNEEISSEFGIDRLNVIMFGLDATTLIPYLLFVIKNQSDEKEISSICKILETYLMRRIVCKCKNSNYSDLFSNYLINEQFLKADALKNYICNIENETSLALPTNTKLKEGFVNCVLVNNRAKGVLYLLESKLRTASHSTSLKSFSSYSLEHLLPKKWTVEKWPYYEPFSDEDRNTILKTLGNLAIITQNLNRSISNNSWNIKLNGTEKIKGLKEYATGLVTMSKVISTTAWNETEILERANWLYNAAKDIWSLESEKGSDPGSAEGHGNSETGGEIPSSETDSSTKDKTKFSLNGSAFLSKRKLAFEIVNCFIEQHPDYTYAQLKEVFSDDLIRPYGVYKGMLASVDELLDGTLTEDQLNLRYSFNDDSLCLKSSDGIEFFVNNQWAKESIERLIRVAEKYGMHIEVNGNSSKSILKFSSIVVDGHTIPESNIAQMFVEFVKLVGAKKVFDLKMPINGGFLVDTKVMEGYENSCKPVDNGYYLCTNSNTIRKIKQIEYIAEKLNLDLVINKYYK